MKLNTLAAYEALARSFSQKIDHKPHNAYYERPNTLSLLPEVENKRVLDAGCGPGKYAQILLDQGAEVMGLDMSSTMIEEAKKRNGQRGEFTVHDLTEPLPAADNFFDIVICPLVLEYILDWSAVFREFRRVLSPGGVFVFSITHPFFDYTYFETKNYFDTEKVSATWTGFGGAIEVETFRRSLMDCLTPLLESGFVLERVLEPRPFAEFRERDPKHYKELNEFPAFLCLRARKG